VLLNLTDNAVKFTARGSIHLAVRPVAPERLEFCVRDTGVGIRPEALGRIFEPFTQEDESTTRRFGGTGLGLAICKRMVALMGGNLTVESAPGVGSTFRFEARLPAVEHATEVPPAALPAPRASFAGVRALLVDDNAINLRIGRGLLERLGCSVATAADGREALAQLEQADFEVVFMDCSMPVMDGFEATAVIRALEGPRSALHIVAMTAYAMDGDRERCLAAGMNDYLTKPVKLEELAAALQRLRSSAAALPQPPA